PRRIVALERREVRVLLERALDGRRAPEEGRTVAEARLEVRLEPVRLEQRRDATDGVAERLLAIPLELELYRDVHPRPASHGMMGRFVGGFGCVPRGIGPAW